MSGLRSASPHAWTAILVTSTPWRAVTVSTMPRAADTASTGSSTPSSMMCSKAAAALASTRSSTMARIRASLLGKYR